MTFNLYSVSDPVNKVNKTLGTALAVSGEFNDNVDILHPVIRVKYNASILNKNYAYLEVTNRYYYISGMNVINGMIELSLDVDALMSHKTDIKASTARIVRTADGSLYLHDDMIVPTTKHDIITRKLGTGFTKQDNYILTIGGNS